MEQVFLGIMISKVIWLNFESQAIKHITSSITACNPDRLHLCRAYFRFVLHYKCKPYSGLKIKCKFISGLINKCKLFSGRDNLSFYCGDLVRARTGEGFSNDIISWGYIDSTGKKAFPTNFVHAEDICEGMARVRENKDWGYINNKGTYIIKPQFENAKDFKGGYARVRIDGKWGLIDTTGTLVVKPTYKSLGEFVNGLAFAEIDGTWGIVDVTGKWVVPANYKYIKKVIPSSCSN